MKLICKTYSMKRLKKLNKLEQIYNKSTKANTAANLEAYNLQKAIVDITKTEIVATQELIKTNQEDQNTIVEKTTRT